MVTEIRSIEKYSEVKQERLPNGEYSGLWGGYEVTFSIAKNRYRVLTKIGVRGMNILCVVIVDKGKITVKTLKEHKGDN